MTINLRNLIPSLMPAQNEFAVYPGELGSHRVTDREVVARLFVDLTDRLAESIPDVIIGEAILVLIENLEAGLMVIADVPDEVLAEVAKFVRRPAGRRYAKA